MDFEIMYQKVRQMLDSKEVSLRETAVFGRDRHKEDPEDPIYKALYDQKLAEWSVVQDLISQIDKMEEAEATEDYTHYIAIGTEGEKMEWTTKD